MTPTQQKFRQSRHNMKITESGGCGTLGRYAWAEGIWRIHGVPHIVHWTYAEPMKRVSKHGWPKGWRAHEASQEATPIIDTKELKSMLVTAL